MPGSGFRIQKKRWLQLVFMFFFLGSADGMGRRLHSAPGLGLSKTPTAEMEHSLHGASTVPASQVVASDAKVMGLGMVYWGRKRGEI